MRDTFTSRVGWGQEIRCVRGVRNRICKRGKTMLCKQKVGFRAWIIKSQSNIWIRNTCKIKPETLFLFMIFWRDTMHQWYEKRIKENWAVEMTFVTKYDAIQNFCPNVKIFSFTSFFCDWQYSRTLQRMLCTRGYIMGVGCSFRWNLRNIDFCFLIKTIEVKITL